MKTADDTHRRLPFLVIANGMIVLLIGLVAGIMLIFSLLGVVTLWPLPVWEITVPGSTRGWQAAHVGGILNGVMIASIALLIGFLKLSNKRAWWVGWGMIITGWGNTIFYWAGNFAPNRGLSMIDTPYGPANLAGILSFSGGGLAMILTFIAVAILAKSALEKFKMP